MGTTGTNETSLVVAAQSGDPRALDELVWASLPLVYTLVGRALSGHPDVDDVVQDIMLRALRDLRALRTPESFRSWLMAIAVRQVGTYLHRRRVAEERHTGLDEVAAAPDAEADVEEVTVLRMELSGQRRQVLRAKRWLGPDDSALLSLWWLETAGELTRAELATAIGATVAHAGVRVQRMRHQLELSRSVVAAWEASPRCAQLSAVAADFDGVPSPLWRKRMARHTRSCAVCARAADGLVASERLLAGFALIPVPQALTAALVTQSGLSAAAAGAAATAAGSGGVAAGVKAGLLGQLAYAVGAHPVAAIVAAGALAAGTAVTATDWPAREPQVSAVAVAPTPALPTRAGSRSPAAGRSAAPARTLSLGPMSLESADEAGRFMSISGDLGTLASVDASRDVATRQRATFEVVRGLADRDCYSFRTRDGGYLRHMYWRLRRSVDQRTTLFRGDATFCVRVGSAADSVSLESANYPGWYLRHIGNELWVDWSDGTAAFRAASSSRIRPPLAG